MADSIKICLWSGPRNISTALMYSFAQRADTRVYDEPLYGFYLANTDADEYHPGAEETLASMEQDGNKVICSMMNDESKPVLFFKNMAHHLLDLDRSFMKDTVNIILTRNPKDCILSFSKVVENPTMSDIGYEVQVDLKKYLDELGAKYLVVDSSDILKNPEKELSAICELAQIPFDSDMLQWEPGARTEDGIWAMYWYSNVHRSRGFQPPKIKDEQLPERLTPLLEESNRLYVELTQA